MRRILTTLVLLAAAGAVAWGVHRRLAELEAGASVATTARAPVPVEVGPVEHGAIRLRRTFSGALEASAEFVAAPKVGGRLQRLTADLGDPVERGQVVAWLDDEELVQAVNEAQAELAVARATRAEAKSALEIAERGLKRAQTLREEGVNSESQLDAARAEELARRAHVEVTEANVTRATAGLEASRIRLDYARVKADWTGGDDRRVVSDRHVDEGGTVSANTPLMSIVELDPIVGVVFVSERDYGLLSEGQIAELTTDAFPRVVFEGRVSRIAPVFRRSTRQARVELLIENGDERLKPGMFVRATIDVRTVEDATVVPFDALTERDDRVGVFALDESGERVAWVPVEVGVRDGARVEVLAEGLSGRVVVLGQELCDDGALVSVAGDDRAEGGVPTTEARSERVSGPADELSSARPSIGPGPTANGGDGDAELGTR